MAAIWAASVERIQGVLTVVLNMGHKIPQISQYWRAINTDQSDPWFRHMINRKTKSRIYHNIGGQQTPVNLPRGSGV